MATQYYYDRANKLIYSLAKLYPPEYYYELTYELGVIRDRIGGDIRLKPRAKVLLFNDQAKAFIDDFFHVSKAKLSSDVVSFTTNKLSKLLGGFTTDVVERTGESLASIQDLGDAALKHVGESSESVKDLTEESQKRISGVYNQVTSQNQSMFDSITEYIANLFSDTTRRVELSHDNLVDTLNEVTEANLGHLTSYYEYTGKQATETAETALGSIVDIGNLAKQTLDLTVSDVHDDIQEYSEAIKSESEQTYNLFSELFSAFTDRTITPLSELASARSENLGMPATESNIGAARQVRSIFSIMFRELAGAVGGSESLPDVIDRVSEDGNWLASLLAAFVYTVANGVLIFSATSIANVARLQELQQKVLAGDPVTDYTSQEAAALLARGFISEDEARAAGLKQGYLYEKTDTLAKASEQPISMSEAISAFRRGFIDEQRVNRNAQRLGYNSDDTETLKSISNVLPAINELILMAVREVFTPDIVSRFELFSELPEEFVNEAAKQGLNRVWAERYWGAHWNLPSFQQGAEMFHRKLIPKEDLDLLVRSLDVSPFWRDKLIGITYNQITRVDIRRIFQLGLIDRYEVKERFEKNGYSPEDSELLTQFYEAYTGDQEEKSALDPKGVTLSQVRDLKKLGTISFDQAVEQLEIVGYDSDYAVILVQSWEDEAQYKARADLINRFTRKAIRLDMNEAEVESLFSELNLTHDELTNVKRVIETERLEYDSIPSKAELFTLASKGIIDYDTWFHMMRRHGYSDEIIGWYRDWKFRGN